MYISKIKLEYVIFTFFLLCFSYFGITSMQGNMDYPGGKNRTISSILTLVIEIYYVITILKNIQYLGKSSMDKLILVWMFIILLSVILTSQSIERLFKDIIYTQFWCLSYLYAFIMIRKNSEGLALITRSFIIILIVNLLLFFYILQLKLGMFNFFDGSNQIYYSFLLLPWVFLLKNEKIKVLLLLVLLVGVVYSFKRNTIILYSLSISVYIYHKYIKVNKSSKFIKNIFLISLIASFISFLEFNSNEFEFVIQRFTFEDLDKTAGRKAIWGKAFKIQKENSSNLGLIFGHGHHSLKKYLVINGKNLSAHNDFLEILFDYGLLIFILYLMLYLILLRRLIYIRKKLKKYYVPYAVSIIVFIGMSMVSHLVLYPTYFIFMTCFWGAIESEILLNKEIYNRPNIA